MVDYDKLADDLRKIGDDAPKARDADYHPDGWCVLKIQTDTELIYKLFASWGGGYLNGDSWKLNSGIKKVDFDDPYFYFEGHSGSVYCVTKNSYNRLSGYTLGVLTRIIEQGIENGYAIEVMSKEDTDWVNLEYSE